MKKTIHIYMLLLTLMLPLVASAQYDYKKTIMVGETFHCSVNTTWVGYIIQSTDFDVSGNGIREIGPRSKLGTTIEAVKPGYGYVFITIYLKKPLGGDTDIVYASWEFDVIDNKPTSISVTPSSCEMYVGDMVGLSVSFKPSGTTSSVTWSSNNTSVATIGTAGYVNAVGPGSATITARTAEGLTGNCYVTVHSVATGISLPQDLTIACEETRSLIPTFSPSGSSVKSMNWKSSNEQVVTVDAYGRLTGVSPGEATVTVTTNNGLSASTHVTVTHPPFDVTCASDGSTGINVNDQGQVYAKISTDYTQGSQFANIRYEQTSGAKVSGTPHLSYDIVYFIPDKPLKPFTTYKFVIPKGALCNKWGGENPNDFIFTFTTGDLDNQSFSYMPTEDYMAPGGTIHIWTNCFNAAIHYTTDGSEPTLKSPVLPASGYLTIDKNVRIRAMAVCDGYKNAYLDRTVKVTHVAAVSYYPDYEKDTLSRFDNVVPFITYNTALVPTSQQKIVLTEYPMGTIVATENYVCGNRIYIVPSEPLHDDRIYSINVPYGFVQSFNGEPNTASLWIISGGKNIKQISAGYEMAVATKQNGELWAWGKIMRQGYNGSFVPDSLIWKPQLIEAGVSSCVAGYSHVVLIDKENEVYTWGRSFCGEMGSLNINSYNGLCYITSLDRIQSDQCRIVAGAQTSAVIGDNGEMTLMGRNDYGQQGDGTTYSVARSQNTLPQNVVQVASGYGSTLALTASGQLYGCGHNHLQQIKAGTTRNQFSFVPVMEDIDYVAASRWDDFAAAVIRKDRTLWMWGSGSCGRLGGAGNIPVDKPVKMLDDVIAVSVGSHVVAAIKSDHSLWMWGDGSYGELTTAAQGIQLTPIRVMEDVANVDIGGQFVVVQKQDGSVWTWGTGKYGELGWGGQIFNGQQGATPHMIVGGHPRTAIEGIQLDTKEICLAVDQTFVVHARPIPLYAEYDQWEWTVSDPTIASVSNNGVVTPLREGRTLVTLISDQGISASYNLLVTDDPDGIHASPAYETDAPESKYFSIDGRALNRPHRGMVIEKKGNKVKKVIIN